MGRRLRKAIGAGRSGLESPAQRFDLQLSRPALSITYNNF